MTVGIKNNIIAHFSLQVIFFQRNGGRKAEKPGSLEGRRLGRQEAWKKVGDVHKYINNCKD